MATLSSDLVSSNNIVVPHSPSLFAASAPPRHPSVAATTNSQRAPAWCASRAPWRVFTLMRVGATHFALRDGGRPCCRNKWILLSLCQDARLRIMFVSHAPYKRHGDKFDPVSSLWAESPAPHGYRSCLGGKTKLVRYRNR